MLTEYLGAEFNARINGLSKASIEIDRKVLADLAVFDKKAFSSLANHAKSCLTN